MRDCCCRLAFAVAYLLVVSKLDVHVCVRAKLPSHGAIHLREVPGRDHPHTNKRRHRETGVEQPSASWSRHRNWTHSEISDKLHQSNVTTRFRLDHVHVHDAPFVFSVACLPAVAAVPRSRGTKVGTAGDAKFSMRQKGRLHSPFCHLS